MHDGSHGRTIPEAPLVLKTLGGAKLLGVTPSGEPHVVFEPGKPLALIVYLASAPARVVPREKLMDVLWAELPRDAALHAIRQTLWYIRRRAGATLIRAAGEQIELAISVRVDRQDFVSSVERGDLERAVTQYTGDFLEGTFVVTGGGAASFEHWAEVEREHLRALFVRTAETVVRSWMDSARFREAAALARRVRDLDPLCQAGWRLLLESLVASGDQVTTGVEADSLLKLLDAEQLEPESTTRAMIRVARRDASAIEAPLGPRTVVADFVGRSQEFESILSRWRQAQAGRAQHVHVRSGAGMGKTRLLAAVHRRLRAARSRAVLLRATPSTRNTPYALAGELARLLAQLGGALGIPLHSASALVALNASLASTYSAQPACPFGDDAARDLPRAFDDLLTAVAEEEPLALLIDDLQWADTSSRGLLCTLIASLDQRRLLIVTSSRHLDGDTMIGARSTVITLSSLSAEAIVKMLASIDGVPEEWTKEVGAMLCKTARGSPARVLEFIRSARDRGLLERGNDTPPSPGPTHLVALAERAGMMRLRRKTFQPGDAPGRPGNRTKHATRLRIAGAAAFSLTLPLLVVVGGAILRRSAPTPADAMLMLVVAENARSHRLYREPIHAATWTSAAPIVINARSAPDSHLSGDSPADISIPMSPLPDASGWTVSRQVPDTGEVDLFEVHLNGTVRRLTQTRGFDRDGSYAPDGTQLAFATERWDSLGHFDLAVLDLRTGAVRPMVRGVASEEQPMWSPDGSRLAFIRRPIATDLADLCFVEQNGLHQSCRREAHLSVLRSPEILGWYDARHLAVVIDSLGRGMLALVDAETGAVAPILWGWRAGRLAPNGRWALCQCTVPGHPDGTWFVFALDRPADFRTVRIDGLQEEPAALVWAPDSPRSPFLHSLKIGVGHGEMFVGVPHRLGLSGYDALGQPVTIGAVTWSSSDSEVAAVDPSGLVIPRRPGSVRVSVSSGGWRTASATLRVRAVESRLVMDERWLGDFDPNWKPFGTPPARVERRPNVPPSLRITGRGLYPTGVYLTRSLRADQGLAVEAEVSAAVIHPDVEAVYVALTSFPDSSTLASWDHAVGFPQPHGQRLVQCTLGIPRGRWAARSGDSLYVVARSSAMVFLGRGGLRGGIVRHFRIQVFPDGRCGVAIDGRPVFIGEVLGTQGPTPAFRLFIYGASYDALIQFHRIRVWTGIPAGVSWTQMH